MQINYRFLWVTAGIISLFTLMVSCNKPSKIELKNEGNIYMPQAALSRGKLVLVLLDTPQAVVFGAAYGGLKYSTQDVTVNFKVDTTLIAAYNLLNGTSYISFPAASYTVPSLTSIIKSGKTSSDPLAINFLTSSLSPTATYMLPVILSSVSPGVIDSSLQITYFTVDRLANIYEGSYHTLGTRHNYNADGTFANDVSIDDTRLLSTLTSNSCSINTIANLGAYNGTVFYITVATDNTVTLSGFLQNDPNVPVTNQPNTTSTYDPGNKSFTVHYMYKNTNGTVRHMDEIWSHN